MNEEKPCPCPGGVGCCIVQSNCPEGEVCSGKGCCVPSKDDNIRLGIGLNKL